jgi:hypothetical protein
MKGRSHVAADREAIRDTPLVWHLLTLGPIVMPGIDPFGHLDLVRAGKNVLARMLSLAAR